MPFDVEGGWRFDGPLWFNLVCLVPWVLLIGGVLWEMLKDRPADRRRGPRKGASWRGQGSGEVS